MQRIHVADVARDRRGLATRCIDLRRDLVTGFLLAARDDHLRAVLRETPGQGFANATAAAGDESDAARQIE